jgi:hypothetical protein
VWLEVGEYVPFPSTDPEHIASLIVWQPSTPKMKAKSTVTRWITVVVRTGWRRADFALLKLESKNQDNGVICQTMGLSAPHRQAP